MLKRHRIRMVVGTLLLLTLAACAPRVSIAPYTETRTQISEEARKERDKLLSLAAYAVVLNDWQDGSGKKRGHNIGSVLTDKNGVIVNWARNCNAALENGTQHGEVRLMVGYLNKRGGYNLKNHTVYTTLEPCAQCSGMMVLTNIKRTVYGQKDPGFGDAIERLKFDGSHCVPPGYKPYPRAVISDRSDTVYCTQLEKAYERAGGSITSFLLSPKAKAIFQSAADELKGYETRFPENIEWLKHVKKTVHGVKPGIPTICIRG